MRTLIIFALVISAAIGGQALLEKLAHQAEDSAGTGRSRAARLAVAGESTHSSGQFGYSLRMPSGFEVDNSVPELTVLRRGDSWLRVNAGCFDFGTEGLRAVESVAEAAGQPALRVEYYDDSELRLETVSFEIDGTCFALEMFAESPAEWEDLRDIAKTFSFVKPRGGPAGE